MTLPIQVVVKIQLFDVYKHLGKYPEPHKNQPLLAACFPSVGETRHSHPNVVDITVLPSTISVFVLFFCILFWKGLLLFMRFTRGQTQSINSQRVADIWLLSKGRK